MITLRSRVYFTNSLWVHNWYLDEIPFTLILFKWFLQVTFPHMSSHLSCRDMRIIVAWFVLTSQSKCKNNFSRFALWAPKSFAKWVPDHMDGILLKTYSNAIVGCTFMRFTGVCFWGPATRFVEKVNLKSDLEKVNRGSLLHVEGWWVESSRGSGCRSQIRFFKNLNPLWCRHNGRDSVSNHRPHDCLLNRVFRHR